MNRKEFVAKVLGVGLGVILIPIQESWATGLFGLKPSFLTRNESVPSLNNLEMKSVFHPANTRGHANHGWLDSHHSFSFANYHNPERMSFGALRVLNDDMVSPGKGFGTHPHENMEIVSIPLEGELEHKDSMGNAGVIRQGEVQVMSAGTGIYHSEYNHSKESDVKFLQIWIIPNRRNVAPRYDQIALNDVETKDELFQILSPNEEDDGVWINQDAWFHMADLKSGKSVEYHRKKDGNGLYVFVLEGEFKIAGQTMGKRDGIGVWDFESLNLESASDGKVLLMEVPMGS